MDTTTKVVEEISFRSREMPLNKTDMHLTKDTTNAQLPNQAISFEQLIKKGFSKERITTLYSTLKLFPTPFKGIYYAPMETEHKGEFIEKPFLVLSQAISLFLENDDFYFSCSTAEQIMNPNNGQVHESVHIVNSRLSRKINIRSRADWNNSKGNWRSRRIAKLLSFYGDEILFHKTSKAANTQTNKTQYGRIATGLQAQADKKRFGVL